MPLLTLGHDSSMLYRIYLPPSHLAPPFLLLGGLEDANPTVIVFQALPFLMLRNLIHFLGLTTGMPGAKAAHYPASNTH